MKYFLHDTNSFNDEKITELFINFGYEGLGLFYTTLEKLAGQEKPVKTNVLKAQLKVGKKLNKCWDFMESLGILSSNNGETFNEQLLNFSEKYLIKNQKTKERVSEWREKQKDTKNVTHSERIRNAPKDNISKVKLSKVKVLYNDNIFLSENEFKNLVSEHGEPLTLVAIKFLNDYKIEKSYKTKSDNLTLKRWVFDAVTKNKPVTSQIKPQISKIEKAMNDREIAKELINKIHGGNEQ